MMKSIVMKKYLAGVVLIFFLTNWMTYANGCESNSDCGIGLYCCRQIRSGRSSCDDTACSSDMDCGSPFSSCSSEKICTRVIHSRSRRSNSKSDSDGLSTGIIVTIVLVPAAFIMFCVCLCCLCSCQGCEGGSGGGGSYWMGHTGGGYSGGGDYGVGGDCGGGGGGGDCGGGGGGGDGGGC